MEFINCPKCNKKILGNANFCPYCGLPIVQKKGDKENDLKNQKMQNPKNTISLKNLSNVFIFFDKEYYNLFKKNHLITSKEEFCFVDKYSKYYEKLSIKENYQFVLKNTIKYKIDIYDLNNFLQKFSTIQNDIRKHNESSIESVLEENREYFDNILKDIDPNIKLDEEQRKAVVYDDNNCLVIAGAGAGKTTTMAAKVKWLVEKKGISPEEIIVISFTNKAISELRERINGILKIPVKISTFHSFAFDIVKKHKTEPPEINFNAYKIIFDMLEKAIFDDKALMRRLVYFMGFYFDITEEALEFKSLNEYHLYKSMQTYETLKSGLNEYIKVVSNQRSKKKKTLTGEYLRSIQEVQIANFLFVNGIEYKYEERYPHEIYGAKKIYTPDFTISQGEHVAYIEHYALTENYTNNRFENSDIQKYIKSIKDKRNLHNRNKTELIETWSFYNDGKHLLSHLKDALIEKGFVLKERNEEEIYKKIVDTGKDKYIYKLIIFMIKFIELYKTAGYTEYGFNTLKEHTDNPRTHLFLDIAASVYSYYQEELERQNQIDFADMINDANFYLQEMQEQNIKLNYKYIIIDEFQDIVKQRFTFTKKLSEVSGAKIIAVGDDWQSIYAFSGSDMTLFTRFIELMGHGVELQITHTYRNSQELINIAGSFIQKNTAQIQKKLLSPKKLTNPIRIKSYDDTNNLYNNTAKCITEAIGNIIDEHGLNSSILLIGRYNFDIYKVCRSNLFTQISDTKVKSVKYPKANITFLTAHSSKGLGYDNVILFNLIEGKFGFPCQIEDDPIMRLVKKNDDNMEFAEERRLFYVALTRTKNRVYLIAPNSKPSSFLIELIKDYGLEYPKNLSLAKRERFSLKCPICGYPLKYEYNNSYGIPLYICTNEPEVCDFMTNNKNHRHDIYKCPKCSDGYMIVKINKATDQVFYGCTNYNNPDNKCTNTKLIN